jgi:exodeoxyribonuclease V alpha subunit
MILAGTVEKIFKSDNSSYKLLSVKASEDLITVIIEGNCPELRQNDLIVLEGDFKISKRFGSYFKGSILQALGSDTSENLVKFLVNLRVKGLGYKTAHRVVQFLRESNQTIENFASTSTWKAIPQVNIRVTRELAKKLQSLNLEERVILNLVKLGIGLKTSQDLWAAKGPLAISAVLADPYKTLLEFPSYRFKRLDALAKKLGIKEEDNRRIKGAILSALMEACEEGHTGLPLAKLTEKVKELTSLSKEPLIAEEIRNLELESRILITPQLAQLRHISDLEKNVAQQLKKPAISI